MQKLPLSERGDTKLPQESEDSGTALVTVLRLVPVKLSIWITSQRVGSWACFIPDPVRGSNMQSRIGSDVKISSISEMT